MKKCKVERNNIKKEILQLPIFSTCFVWAVPQVSLRYAGV